MVGSKRLPSWWWKAVVVLVLGAIVIRLPLLLFLPFPVAVLVGGGIAVYRLAHRPCEARWAFRPGALPFLWVMLSPRVTMQATRNRHVVSGRCSIGPAGRGISAGEGAESALSNPDHGRKMAAAGRIGAAAVPLGRGRRSLNAIDAAAAGLTGGLA